MFQRREPQTVAEVYTEMGRLQRRTHSVITMAGTGFGAFLVAVAIGLLGATMPGMTVRLLFVLGALILVFLGAAATWISTYLF